MIERSFNGIANRDDIVYAFKSIDRNFWGFKYFFGYLIFYGILIFY